MPDPKLLNAEERSTQIAKAMSDWRRLCAGGAKNLDWGARQVHLQEQQGYWAFFGKTKANTKLGWRYWNAFGISPEPHWSVLVEINPPQSGIARGTQGLIALDRAGRRWVLHGGRVHPGDERVDFDRFAKLSGLKPIEVRFSDGSRRGYFVVAPLDQGVSDFHHGMGAFIRASGYVRNAVLFGKEEAALDRHVEDGEGQSTPEKRGGYVIPPRPAAEAERVHGDVWDALSRELDRRGIKHSNARVGRYGPDLRTRAKKPTLFEIKTDTTARSVYEALGQLLVYERLLRKAHRKALVAPGVPPPKLVSVLKEFEIAIIIYRAKGRSYRFDEPALDHTIRSK